MARRSDTPTRSEVTEKVEKHPLLIGQIGQRIGAPLGAAVLAIVLQQQLAVAAPPIAYGSTFWWSLAFTAPALLPAVFLRRVSPRAGADVGHGRDGRSELTRVPRT